MGAHVSIAGGLDKAPQRGHEITCECIQIFSKNQNQWRSKPFTESEVEGFKTGLVEYNIQGVLIHSAYLINIASPEEAKHRMSYEAFIDEIDRADMLGVEQFVFHPGSHKGQGEEYGLNKIAETLNLIIESRPHSKVKILMENTAGQGTNLGYRFEHLAAVIDKVEDKARMGVCFDTAHAFAAGYDLTTPQSYEDTWRAFDQIVGLEKLLAFHLNDSKKALASRVDRHHNIGDGLVGLDMFKSLLNDSRFAGLCMYLETPGGDEAYIRDFKTLRTLYG